jgi:ABC-2 type transport system ATP-binding protein
MEIVKVNNLKKKYDDELVVKGIDVILNTGEVFGILGPNGAGKTTTISMMSAQLEPSEGYVKINNLDTKDNTIDVKAIVGIVPQEIALYDVLNAYENLEFFGSLYGLKGKELKSRINWILELVGLKERARTEVGKYSGGMKRRINIAAAILHNPKVLFMDEPTVGIDPQSRNHILDLVKLLKEQGMTIIYTTHYMEEATAICDRIAIMDKGTIIKVGTTQDLIGLVCDGIIELVISDEVKSELIYNKINNLENTIEIQKNSNKVSVIVKDIQSSMSAIMKTLADNGIEVDGINVMPPTLETLFLYLTGKTLRD